MIRSMTGFGRAEYADDRVRIVAEIRTVNNRGLKVSPRLPDGMTALEVPIEKLVRRHLTRGTVLLNLIVEPRGPAARVPVNADLLAAYWQDVESARERLGAAGGGPPPLEALLALPGVVGAEEVWLETIEDLPERVEGVVAEALDRLDAMRTAEGDATARDLAVTLEAIEGRLATIRSRAPEVVADYRRRLSERVEMLLEGTALAAEDPTLMREIAFFAERSDISEELARLASHIAQFREVLAAPEPAGRRMEFIAQEMYREINTVGSKANDAEIAREAVEVKVGVDRLREQSQNIE